MVRKRVLLWEIIPGAAGSDYIPGAVLLRKAEVLEMIGDWPGAEASYVFLYEKAQALGWPERLRPILKRYGLLQQRLNRLSQAWENFQQLYDLAESSGDRLSKIDALTGFGVVLWKQGRLAEAEASYRQAASLLQMTADEERLSALENNLGVLLENMGRYQEALECYRKKMAREERRKNLAGLSRLYNNLGICYLHQEDLDNASRCLHKRMELALRMGDIYGQANALVNLAVLDRMRSRYLPALEKYERARELYSRLGEKRISEVTLNLNMGNIHLDLKEYSTAQEYFYRCLAAAEKYEDRKTQGIVYYNLGQIEYQKGDSQKALEYCRQSIEILEQTLQPYYLLETLMLRAEVLCQLKQWPEARAVLTRSLELACRLNKKETESRIRELIAKLDRDRDEIK